MSEPSSEGLFGQFLRETDIAARAKITRAAIDGRTPDEAVSLLFASLTVAVDHLRTALEILVSNPHIDAEDLNAKIQERVEIRSGDYFDYQFKTITERLGEGTST